DFHVTGVQTCALPIYWCGWPWPEVTERPEHFLPGGLLAFLLPALLSQARYSGFAATYRIIGMLALLLPLLILANWGNGSYLPFGIGRASCRESKNKLH